MHLFTEVSEDNILFDVIEVTDSDRIVIEKLTPF